MLRSAKEAIQRAMAECFETSLTPGRAAKAIEYSALAKMLEQCDDRTYVDGLEKAKQVIDDQVLDCGCAVSIDNLIDKEKNVEVS